MKTQNNLLFFINILLPRWQLFIETKLNEHFRLEKETNARINIALQRFQSKQSGIYLQHNSNKKIYGKMTVVYPSFMAKIMTIIVVSFPRAERNNFTFPRRPIKLRL